MRWWDLPHWPLRKAFLSLLAMLWNSAFKWVCLSFSALPVASLLFSAICKASSDNYFAFLHFFFLGMVLITASCTMSWTSICSFSGTLSIRSNPLNLIVTPTIIIDMEFTLQENKARVLEGRWGWWRVSNNLNFSCKVPVMPVVILTQLHMIS